MVFGVEVLNLRLKTHICVAVILCVSLLSHQSVSQKPNTTEPSTTNTPEETSCEDRNSSCSECVKDSSCFWCFNPDYKGCHHYDIGIQTNKNQDKCGGFKDIAWKTCFVKLNVLAITLGSIGGVLLLGIIIGCCCCCKKCNRAQMRRQMAKFERQRLDRQAAADQRKTEREVRRQEMREKYGLGTVGDQNKYQRFE